MKGHLLGREGFSLIEAVITMAVVAIAIAALLSTINISTKMQIETEKEIAAKNEARRIVEAMKGYTCDQIVSMYSPEAAVSVSGFDQGDEASGTVTVDSTDPTLLEVAVRIRWKIGEVGGQKRFRTFEVRRRVSDQDNG
jgi:prepilin-type N-terminal cleavage/methylation domain-containing protein